jgi:hypothetical protein
MHDGSRPNIFGLPSMLNFDGAIKTCNRKQCAGDCRVAL